MHKPGRRRNNATDVAGKIVRAFLNLRKVARIMGGRGEFAALQECKPLCLLLLPALAVFALQRISHAARPVSLRRLIHKIVKKVVVDCSSFGEHARKHKIRIKILHPQLIQDVIVTR